MATEKGSAIVTGGASGLGLAMSKLFASQGKNVAVFDISPDGANIVEALTSEFKDARLLFKKCDVSDWDEQKAVFEQVYKDFGRIDIVMANAGIAAETSLVADEETPTKPSIKSTDVNLYGVIYSVKLAIHYMKKNKPTTVGTTPRRGSIICTASSAGIYPFPFAPLYGCAKHGIVGLARSLTRPLELLNIQINSLAPALIETKLTGEKSKELHKKMVKTPMSTLLTAVRKLTSDPSIMGQVAVLHGEHITFSPHAPWVDKDVEKIYEHFWESRHLA